MTCLWSKKTAYQTHNSHVLFIITYIIFITAVLKNCNCKANKTFNSTSTMYTVFILSQGQPHKLRRSCSSYSLGTQWHKMVHVNTPLHEHCSSSVSYNSCLHHQLEGQGSHGSCVVTSITLILVNLLKHRLVTCIRNNPFDIILSLRLQVCLWKLQLRPTIKVISIPFLTSYANKGFVMY